METKTEELEVSEGPQRIQSVNPNTGELIGEVTAHGSEEVRQAVERARQAQVTWAAMPLKNRLAIMREVQSALVANADAIASLVAREVGKPITEALVGDVLLVLTSLTGYIRMAKRTLRPRRLRTGFLHFGKKYRVVNEPLGVVAVISPFNFPVLLSMQPTFAALIAGNAVVHKPSEHTPLSAELIKRLLHGTQLDPGLFQVVHGYGDTGWALVHADVDHVSFVGSTHTGKKIAGAAGARLIRSLMELGGNNAMIVLDDAPLERAANAAMTFGFATSGQMCGAVSRLLVQEPVIGRMEVLLHERLREWRTSPTIDPGQSEVTALINRDALFRVQQNVAQALDLGAKSLHDAGKRQDEGPPIFGPVILTHTSPEMAIRREETFGPVISLIPFKVDAEAVRLANETEHGLTASVWSRNLDRAEAIAGQLKVGSVAVNDHLWPFFAPEVPWGGIKASGGGRLGGAWGLEAMTYPKVYSIGRTTRPREFYWQPATRRTHRVVRELISFLYDRRWHERLKAGGRMIRKWFEE